MITEKDVMNSLPPEGFVKRYVEYASRQTTSPLGYHLGTALTVLAATCPTNYGMPYAGQLRANMFTLLVGRSGEDQKSTALNIGKGLLDAASPALIGDYPASAEGLIDSVARQNTQMIPMPEFGKFLASAQRGYFEPIKTTLTDLWDSEPTQRARANNQTVRIATPRLSVLTACSIPYLEKHTLSEDWTGGFLSRWAVMYCQRERTDPDPVGDTRGKDQLIDDLIQRVEIEEAGWCVGLDDRARELWNAWYFDLEKQAVSGHLRGVMSRVPTIARKVALIYAWDYGVATRNQPWRMGLDVLYPALQFAGLHLKSSLGLADRIADNPDARLRRQILLAVAAMGGLCSLGQLLGMLKLRKRVVVEMIDNLLEEGKITRRFDGSSAVYTLSSISSDGQ